jgi:hypothetical protein
MIFEKAVLQLKKTYQSQSRSILWVTTCMGYRRMGYHRYGILSLFFPSKFLSPHLFQEGVGGASFRILLKSGFDGLLVEKFLPAIGIRS